MSFWGSVNAGQCWYQIWSFRSGVLVRSDATPFRETHAPGSDQFHEETDFTVGGGRLRQSGAWLRPVSRGNRHFTIGGGRLRQSGPQPEGRLLRQPVLEGLTRSVRTETPRKVGRNKFRRGAAAQGGFWERREAAAFGALGMLVLRTSGNVLLISLLRVVDSRYELSG
ncbi:receptor-like protein kinase [Dorcoceras hygrometricum]|uniref:Receptor-like protein kinase n=1 Tax=Dorcoceras hygrometricum TaxID=472368 RepID=A0A2Z7AYU4_9LAMI|nr:receptor-like protein kinase [Dorcoceras hygrometricum]